MPLVQLDLQSLNDLDDGRVSVAFAHELRRAVSDCIDRPGDKTARGVSLEFKLTPVIGEDGTCEGAEGEFQIKSKVPARRSKTFNFDVRRGGQLVFSSTNPTDINQTTFEDVDPATGRVKR